MLKRNWCRVFHCNVRDTESFILCCVVECYYYLWNRRSFSKRRRNRRRRQPCLRARVKRRNGPRGKSRRRATWRFFSTRYANDRKWRFLLLSSMIARVSWLHSFIRWWSEYEYNVLIFILLCLLCLPCLRFYIFSSLSRNLRKYIWHPFPGYLRETSQWGSKVQNDYAIHSHRSIKGMFPFLLMIDSLRLWCLEFSNGVWMYEVVVKNLVTYVHVLLIKWIHYPSIPCVLSDFTVHRSLAVLLALQSNCWKRTASSDQSPDTPSSGCTPEQLTSKATIYTYKPYIKYVFVCSLPLKEEKYTICYIDSFFDVSYNTCAFEKNTKSNFLT